MNLYRRLALMPRNCGAFFVLYFFEKIYTLLIAHYETFWYSEVVAAL